jgi:hypothetical protein
MSDREPFLNRVGWFIGYNAAKIHSWLEDAYNSTVRFIKNIPDNIRLFFLRF